MDKYEFNRKLCYIISKIIKNTHDDPEAFSFSSTIAASQAVDEALPLISAETAALVQEAVSEAQKAWAADETARMVEAKREWREELEAENKRLSEALRLIASCETVVKGDCVDIARAALNQTQEKAGE